MTIVRVRFTPNGVPTPGKASFVARHDEDNRPIVSGRDILSGNAEWEDVPVEGKDIDVRPQDAGWHYVVRVKADGHPQQTTTVLVPPNGPVDFGSLVRYDPKAGMAYEPDPDWWAWTDSLTKTITASADVFMVPHPGTADAQTVIQSAIDKAGAQGGGVARLQAGRTYNVNGTLRMRSNVTLDINGATIRATSTAAFDAVNLGVDVITGNAFNPATIKPVVSVIGAPESRLTNVQVIGGTIDGNGYNQPDDGSYANVAVHDADYTLVDVTSVDARPGITINVAGSGANTGRRAFCLFVGRAFKTTIRGVYRNAGYDAIGLRGGAEETLLDNVSAFEAAKGSVQIATGALRTKIIGGIYDNTGGGTTASHAIFCHSAHWVDVIGATMRANTGSCFVVFGDNTWGTSSEVTLTSCAMDQVGTAPMVNFPTAFAEQIAIDGLTFRKTAPTGMILIMQGSTPRFYARNWTGSSTSTSNAFVLNDADDFEFSNMDVQTAATGNQHFRLSRCTNGRITGKYRQLGGVNTFLTDCSDIEVSATLVAADSVQILGTNSGIRLDGCDFRGVTNGNKLRIFGPTSGSVRNVQGARTEGTGKATVSAASTTVTVTHGLWQGTGTTATPRTDWLWEPGDFQVSFTGNPGAASSVWVQSATSTQVTFATDAAPGADVGIAWSARMIR